jgi:drug/metabolite transporter (DMT)-like permease
MKSSNLFTAYSAMVAAVIVWGISFVATKVALEGFPTFTLIFFRFGAASCCFMILIARRGFPKFSRKDHGKLFIMALFEPGLYFIFETLGLQYTSAAKASLIIATIPVVIMVLSALFLGERTGPVGIIGIFLSLVGIGVLVVGDPKFDMTFSGPLAGDLLIVGAVLSCSVYMVIARDLGRGHSPLEITMMQIIYGAVFFAPLFLWELPAIQWGAVSGRAFIALVYLAFFSTIGAFLCNNYALSKIPASQASVFINGIPVVTAISAWFLLGEVLTGLQLAGGALVLLAVFLTNLPALLASCRKKSN